MQKALLRQLKRSIGVADAAALDVVLAQAATAAETAPPELRGLLQGFANLLGRVGEAYDQYERDLELRTRSLALSSAELSTANDQLRHELDRHSEALIALRAALADLRTEEFRDTSGGNAATDDIAELSQRISRLATAHESSRRALANQIFALDQHAIVSMTDLAGNITYANDRFCEISGYSREALIGHPHRIVRSGIHPPAFYAHLWETITQGQVWHGEVCNRAADGHLYWVNATIVPLLDAQGLPEQYIGIRTDITDRKRIEGQLSEQLKLVEDLIEAIPLPLYIKNTEGRYLRINRAFELFFAASREDYIGRTLHDLLRPEDARIHAEADTELFARGGTQSYECVVHSRSGEAHHAIYRKAALTDSSGRIHGLLGTIIDITERKAAEMALHQAKEAAEAASRAKSDFLANMSHEIRTPMNGIIGMTDLALDTALTDEQREFLSIVKSSSEALLTIINDILDFSKIEAGKLMVEQISYDLHKTVAESLKTMALRAHEKHLELVLEIQPEVPQHVIGDPGRLRQVLVNLLGNAIKFTHQGEIAVHVTLTATHTRCATVQFSVRDTGIGIAPEKQEAIFEAFTQEDTSTTRRYGGTGLGLSISRRLVELMNGHIWLESRRGEGSTFSFALDLEVDPNPPQARATPLDLRGKRILVVDDNATNRRVINGMLEQWAIVVRSVDSAAAAVDVLVDQGESFDCIILDAHMPEVDGYTLASALRAGHGIETPMIMLSSGAMRGDAQHCQEIGIAGFFAKPISSQELLAALCRVYDIARDNPRNRQLVTRHALRQGQDVLEILLVEDHPVNQKLALNLLEKWGHRATLANNGQEALDRLATQEFDLVFMDVQMPVMGGIEATRLIRARERAEGRPRVPIIAMTANAMQGDREICLEAGMDDYLSKPLKPSEMLDKLLKFGRQGSEPPVFDYARALTAVDQEVVEIIAGVFLDTWAGDMARLVAAQASGDMAAIEREAHSFKGSLAAFGAEPAVRIAQAIEAQARQGAAALPDSDIAALQHEIEQLLPHLKAINDRISG